MCKTLEELLRLADQQLYVVSFMFVLTNSEGSELCIWVDEQKPFPVVVRYSAWPLLDEKEAKYKHGSFWARLACDHFGLDPESTDWVVADDTFDALDAISRAVDSVRFCLKDYGRVKKMKFMVTVTKSLDVEVPVEAPDENTARKLIQDLLSEGDTKFMFDGFDSSAWDYEIRFTEAISEEKFERLARESEVVREDGSHEWA